MKRHYAIILASILISSSALAQQKSTEHKRTIQKVPVFYLGTATGLNNPYGFIGIDGRIPANQQVTIDGGLGASTWGSKVFLGARYYLKNTSKGFAFGGGFSHSSGFANLSLELETVAGRQQVTLDLKSVNNVFVTAAHYWSLGGGNSSFFVASGFSVPLNAIDYTIKQGYPLTDASQKIVKILAPKGLMINLGLSFAINKRLTK